MVARGEDIQIKGGISWDTVKVSYFSITLSWLATTCGEEFTFWKRNTAPLAVSYSTVLIYIKGMIEKLRDQEEVTVVVDREPVPPTAYELAKNITKKTYRFRKLVL